jgi:hypothetical protein
LYRPSNLDFKHSRAALRNQRSPEDTAAQYF